MSITLNHTIVPARDKEAAARFFAQLFGLAYEGIGEHFAPVKVHDTLTFLFDDDSNFESHHYAFHVSDTEFDTIFRRVQEANLVWQRSVGRRRPQTQSQGRREGRLLQGSGRPSPRAHDGAAVR